MSKRLTKTREMAVTFCERCGQVCNSTCRADALRERARLQMLSYGWRLA